MDTENNNTDLENSIDTSYADELIDQLLNADIDLQTVWTDIANEKDFRSNLQLLLNSLQTFNDFMNNKQSASTVLSLNISTMNYEKKFLDLSLIVKTEERNSKYLH